MCEKLKQAEDQRHPTPALEKLGPLLKNTCDVLEPFHVVSLFLLLASMERKGETILKEPKRTAANECSRGNKHISSGIMQELDAPILGE